MRILALLVLVGCTDTGPDYPIITQGGAPPGGQGTTPTFIIGRVCVLTDPRNFASCITVGAGSLTVTVGNQVTTTAQDGSFTINVPTTGTGPGSAFTPTITVTGVGIIPSSQTVSPNALVPVLREDLFSRILAANGITLTPGSGSIMAAVVRGGVPVGGVTATSTPSPAFGPFFDGTTPTAWTLDATGAQGIVFFPGFNVGGPVNLTFTDLATSTETTVGGVQVINGGLTFVEGNLP